MTRVLSLVLAALCAVPSTALVPGPAPALVATMAVDPGPAPAALGPARVYVRVVDWRHMDHSDVVGAACDRLNLRCEPSTYTTGAVTIVLTELPVIVPGVGAIVGASSGTACEGRVWAVSDELVVTHELGHALGLDHVGDVENVMYPSREGGDKLTRDQLTAVRAGARVLRSCA